MTFAVIAAVATAGFAGLTLLRQLGREQAVEVEADGSLTDRGRVARDAREQRTRRQP